MQIDAIHNMDCLDGLRALPDECVDLTVASPPYDKLRTYNGSSRWNQEAFAEFAPELYRVTKKGGVVVWIIGDMTVKGSETGTSFRNALGFMDVGFGAHDWMIYRKRGVAFPETNRYYPGFEFMFVLSKGKPKTAHLLRDRPNLRAGSTTHGTERMSDGRLIPKTCRRRGVTRIVPEMGVRYNVWEYPIGAGHATKDRYAYRHSAIFPERLAEDHIRSWSAPGDLVLDPFLGSGTTAKMAILNDRHYLGYEIDPVYCAIARRRVADALARKAAANA
jgi:site-specific DNA-methyltransferase (adenine-specific)